MSIPAMFNPALHRDQDATAALIRDPVMMKDCG